MSLSTCALLLRGYNAAYPLTDFEKSHLRLLVCCRLSCSGTLGAYSIAKNPGNEYLLVHSQPCRDALDLLWNKVPAAHLDSLFHMAMEPGRGDDDAPLANLLVPNPVVWDLFSSIRSQDGGVESDKSSKRARPSCPQSVPDRREITFVTGNKKKLEEVKAIMAGCGKDIVNAKIDLPELQGDPLYVSREKCLLAAKEIGGPVITEDTSLCFNALNGMPGPYIKWFLDKLGHEGLNSMLAGFDDKSAYAQTVVAYCEGPGMEVKLFDGRTAGRIVPARGAKDFGWDPIFECGEGNEGESKGVTYAEMDKLVKNKVSHRGKAFEMLKDWIA